MDFFFVAFREASWNFPRQDHYFRESRGFPGMELGIFRVAKSSGEGRARNTCTLHSSAHECEVSLCVRGVFRVYVLI